MTREDIEKALKMPKWMDDEDDNGNPIISATIGNRKAIIKEKCDGTVFLAISCWLGDHVAGRYKVLTLEEAKAKAREIQVDDVCNDFNLEQL